MRTLHLVSYEKFLPNIVDVIEGANPQNNRYVAFDARGDLPYELKHVNGCRVLKGGCELDDALLSDLAWCDAVFFHPLFPANIKVLEAVPEDKAVVWCGMGADYYDLSPRFRNRLYLPLTKDAYARLSENRPPRRKLVKDVLRRVPLIRQLAAARRRLLGLSSMSPIERNAARVDFMPVLEPELELEKVLPGFRAKRLPYFSYYSLERGLSAGAGPVDGPDVLIGNSASWANNHLDLFDLMQDLDLDGRRIVLPLSYGNPVLGDLVEARAREVFGSERVLALRGWMSIEDYNRTLSRCGTVFMNHVRGQALGNICSMLYRGATVHLRPENPYGEFLEELGVAFRHIPNQRLGRDALAPLSASDRQLNTRLMHDYWHQDAVMARTKLLLSEVATVVDRRGNGVAS